MGPGDVVILYTDGLVESYDERIDVGISHLMEIIGQWPPEALLDCDALTKRLPRHPTRRRQPADRALRAVYRLLS